MPHLWKAGEHDCATSGGQRREKAQIFGALAVPVSSAKPQGWFLFQEQLAGLAESTVYILGAPGSQVKMSRWKGKGSTFHYPTGVV